MSDLPRDVSADFSPTANWPRLRLRAELLKRLRDFFAERDFLEVETPLVSSEVVVERHIEPLAMEATAGSPAGWLQSSPEAHMKRLLASGAPAIYQVTRSFRGGERGTLHNPEFTMVEWYRPGDSMDEGMGLLSELAETLLRRGPAERISYREAFLRFAKFDPFSAEVTVSRLAEIADRHKIDLPDLPLEDRDALLDLIRDHVVEPRLGGSCPTIVYDWPASQAALARVRNADPPVDDPPVDDPPVAERFELYVDGIELANGYHELTDAAELRRRQKRVAAERATDGKAELPQPARLLAAMEHGLPACTGVALGFDRVVMLASGANSIDEVIAFPGERA